MLSPRPAGRWRHSVASPAGRWRCMFSHCWVTAVLTAVTSPHSRPHPAPTHSEKVHGRLRTIPFHSGSGTHPKAAGMSPMVAPLHHSRGRCGQGFQLPDLSWSSPACSGRHLGREPEDGRSFSFPFTSQKSKRNKHKHSRIKKDRIGICLLEKTCPLKTTKH